MHSMKYQHIFYTLYFILHHARVLNNVVLTTIYCNDDKYSLELPILAYDIAMYYSIIIRICARYYPFWIVDKSLLVPAPFLNLLDEFEKYQVCCIYWFIYMLTVCFTIHTMNYLPIFHTLYLFHTTPHTCIV